MKPVKHLPDSMAMQLRVSKIGVSELAPNLAPGRIMRLMAVYQEEISVLGSLGQVESYLINHFSIKDQIVIAYQVLLQRRPDPEGWENSFRVIESYGLRKLLVSLYCSDEHKDLQSARSGSRLRRMNSKLKTRVSALLLRLGFVYFIKV